MLTAVLMAALCSPCVALPVPMGALRTTPRRFLQDRHPRPEQRHLPHTHTHAHAHGPGTKVGLSRSPVLPQAVSFRVAGSGSGSGGEAFAAAAAGGTFAARAATSEPTAWGGHITLLLSGAPPLAALLEGVLHFKAAGGLVVAKAAKGVAEDGRGPQRPERPAVP